MPDKQLVPINGSEKTLETILRPFPTEDRERVTRGFYNVASGDPASPLVQWALMMAELVYALQKRAESSGSTNRGVSPDPSSGLKDTIDALVKSVAAMKKAFDEQTEALTRLAYEQARSKADTGNQNVESLGHDISQLTAASRRMESMYKSQMTVLSRAVDELRAQLSDQKTQAKLKADSDYTVVGRLRRRAAVVSVVLVVALVAAAVFWGFTAGQLAGERTAANQFAARLPDAIEFASDIRSAGGSVKWRSDPDVSGFVIFPGRLALDHITHEADGSIFIAQSKHRPAQPTPRPSAIFAPMPEQ